MNITPPKKVAIIGIPGSGKSTFAIKLGTILKLPVHHLDKHVFDGKNKRNKAEFLKIKENLVNQDKWIIEGCSISTLEMRFKTADVIFYFDFSRFVCLWRILKRFLFKEKFIIKESGCLHGINWKLIEYIWNFKRDEGKIIADLRKKFPQVIFIELKNSKEVNRLLLSTFGEHKG